MKRRTILSMEQALSLPYATLRFAQLGWRVIRIESTPSGEGLPGDPNRYIGGRVADDDRRSYFIAPNVGKEAIALNLKDPQGQEVLRRLIVDLDVDMFCCNTVPKRYKQLGIDYERTAPIEGKPLDDAWGFLNDPFYAIRARNYDQFYTLACFQDGPFGKNGPNLFGLNTAINEEDWERINTPQESLAELLGLAARES